MDSNYSTQTNSSDSPRIGKRPNNYSVLAAFAVIGAVTWLVGGSHESPCLAGACLVAALEQSSIPHGSAGGRTAPEAINKDIAKQTRETDSLGGAGHEVETRSALPVTLEIHGRKRDEDK